MPFLHLPVEKRIAMKDWKTFDWYETRDNQIERTRSNAQLDSVTQWIVTDLQELLLPMSEGGTWKRAVYPGIYEERRCDMDALAQKNGISRMTLWRHMNKL